MASADGGHPAAARFLGLILLRGMDVVPDLERAVGLLRQAAERGDAEAAWWLAAYLGGSRDQRQDVAEAVVFLERAARLGQNPAGPWCTLHPAAHVVRRIADRDQDL